MHNLTYRLEFLGFYRTAIHGTQKSLLQHSADMQSLDCSIHYAKNYEIIEP